MKRYTLAVTSPEYWSEIHDALIVDSNQDGIPDRKITCSDCKEHSPTRGTYELTEEEATEIGNHPHVKWIELSPIDNPGHYPNPQPATKRFPKDVKIYRDLSSANGPPTSPTSAEVNRTNYAMVRVGFDTNGDFYGTASGNIGVRTDNLNFSLTGKNVDLIIHDSGIQQYHPEFIDGNGQSRVSDIVLDGPYTIDPAYFNNNSLTYTKADGRVGIATTAAHEWWENTSKRSGAFSSVGTVAIPNAYTMNNSMGIGGTVSGLTSGHGTGCAGLAAGNNFGLAFEANIWNMPGIGDAVSLGIEANYDLMKIFHQNKPVNSLTGRKNPTVINGSWGYQAAFSSGNTVSYKFQGGTGTFTGNAATSSKWQAARVVTFAGGDVHGTFTIDGNANVDSVGLTIQSGSLEYSMISSNAILNTDSGADPLWDNAANLDSKLVSAQDVKDYVDNSTSSGLAAQALSFKIGTGTAMTNVKYQIEDITAELSHAGTETIDLSVAVVSSYESLADVYMNGQKLRYGSDSTGGDYYFDEDDLGARKRIKFNSINIEVGDVIEAKYFIDEPAS